MGTWRNILQKPFDSITELVLFTAMFALPWLNIANLSTLLLIGLGGLVLLQLKLSGHLHLIKQVPFLLFLLYYVYLLISFYLHPSDTSNREALEQKASLIAIPALFLLLLGKNNGLDLWNRAIAGFIYGNIFAAICCVTAAVVGYIAEGDVRLFFYHTYSGILHLSAIYFSIYLLIAAAYIISYIQQGGLTRLQRNLWVSAGLFLYLNILLLSSKLIIIVGSLFLLLFFMEKLVPRMRAKLVFAGMGICIAALLACTSNPVKKRFTDIDLKSYSAVFHTKDFTNFPFDGLNLRLLLWDLGVQLINDNKAWVFGLEGGHYHEALNSQIESNKLYTGNHFTEDTGYKNYNLHNQYFESYVQFGLAGIATLLMLMAYLLVNAWRDGQTMLLFIVSFFAACFLTESILETQSGILLFTVLISGEWILSQEKRQLALS